MSSPPSRPAKVKARARKGQRVLVTWRPVSGSTVDYTVQLRRTARGSWGTVSVTRVNSWSGRLPVTRSVKKVAVRVVATNRDGVSSRPSRAVPVRVLR